MVGAMFANRAELPNDYANDRRHVGSAPHRKMRCGRVLTERFGVAVDLVEVVGGPLRVLHHVKAQTVRFVAHGGGGVLRDSGQTVPLSLGGPATTRSGVVFCVAV